MLERKSFAFLSKAAITYIFLSPSQFRDVIFHIIDTELFLNNVEFTIHLSFDFQVMGN